MLFLSFGGDMKSGFVLVVGVLLVVGLEGCGLLNSRFLTREFEVGQVMEASVGSTMIAAESGFRNDIDKGVVVGQRFELVYGGLARDVVRITYREFDFENGKALRTPAYFQNLQYDLKASKVIAFRKTMIEVIEAGPQTIVFKVLDDPDPDVVD